ncbi:copper transport outer membrane protein MctB [Micromonospora sp. Llam0]|uniref:copper transporter n=1 Tax=Micromonospora sp. Llam0 TaxID=2485143 RepID=UPI000F4831E9|nr:copper transporter [Micromonospora sp. Llam0]ROO59708.1 copper transport outer membrane protein MctB [Micromonospora sp. Llam0]
MINFRYHVVSLTAVFLALAIGLVVGTAALNGPVADSLSDNVNALRKDNTQLRETVNSLREEVNREEDFVAEAAPILLADKLAGRRLLVVCLPSGRDHAEGVMAALDLAGATLTGRIDVQDKFVNPDNSVELLELATAAARPTIPTTGLPGNSDGVETSSALLASALVDREEPPAVEPADLAALLDAYGDAGYITVEQEVTGPAEAVVVVSGQPYVDRDAAKKDAAVVTMVVQFDRVSQVVVAGTGSSDGNLISAVRNDPTLNQSISTVDNGNTTAGQSVTALAVAEQFTLDQAGHYGLGAGATSLMPKRPE